jgi:hypothetical protein
MNAKEISVLPDGLHEPPAASCLTPHTGGQAEALVGAAVVQLLDHLDI